MGYTPNLSEGLYMTLKKELETLTRIKPYIKVSRISQDHPKSISNSPRKTNLKPIDLSTLSRKKIQFMI
jgi:hypothetical protein